LGITSDPQKLFQWLKKDIGKNHLVSQDFDEQMLQSLFIREEAQKEEKLQSLPERPGTAPAMLTSKTNKTGGMLPSATGHQRPGTAPPPRNKETRNSTMTLAASVEQIRVLKEAQDKQAKKDKGFKTVEDLKRILVMNFGSLFSAWRNGLDLDGNGKISFGEFCLAMRNLGYGGDVKDMWMTLDCDNSGFISLNEFDEQTHQEVMSYRELVLEKYGGMLQAWMKDIDTKGAGQISEACFVRHCGRLGYKGNAKKLFNAYKQEKGRRLLPLRDYDTLAFNAFQRGDLEMLADTNISQQNIAKMSFQERQASCFSQRWARHTTKMDLEDIVEREKVHKSKDKSAHCVDSLIVMLRRKFGTIPAAWKHVIDVCGNGRVPFGEFCVAMRRMGFSGNIQAIFNELDSNGAGAITLHDLDPAAAQLLADFRKCLLDRYGTYIKAWKVLDESRNGIVEENELVESCVKMNFGGDARLLYKYLLDGPGKTGIHMEDLDPAAMQAFYRGELEVLSPLEKAKRRLEQAQAARKAEMDLRMGASDWKALKRELTQKFGSITAAWRNGLDYSRSGKISFVEFSKACRDMRFQGDAKKIFEELDTDGSGIITFDEVDHEWTVILTNFHNALLEKYQTYESAWRALDGNGNNMLQEYELEEVFQEIGFKDCSSKALFLQLRCDKHQRYLTLADIEVKGAILGGIMTAGGRSDKKRITVNSLLNKRDNDHLSKDDLAKADLDRAQQQRQSVKDKQLGANNVKALKELLTRKYGSITASWRHGLDFSGNGKCSFTEFSRACREIGFSGDIKGSFAELDVNGTGIITFDEYDHGWYTKLCSFRDLMEAKYVDLDNFFKVLDTNKNNTVEQAEIAQACEEIGYADNPDELFKQLRKDPSRRFVSMEDLNAKGVITWAVTRFDDGAQSTSTRYSVKSVKSVGRPGSK